MKYVRSLIVKSVFLLPLNILKFFIVDLCIENKISFFNECGRLLINKLESHCLCLIFLNPK